MGYDHYFPAMRVITDEEWSTLTHHVMYLLERLPDQVPGSDEDALLRIAFASDINLPPLVNAEVIRFNGSDLAQHYRQPQLRPFAGPIRFPEQFQHTVPEGPRRYLTELHQMNAVLLLTEEVEDPLSYEPFVLERTPSPAPWEQELKAFFPWISDEENAEPFQSGWSERYPYGFRSVRTNWRPYDFVVCVVLIVAHTDAPGWLRISSSGSASDWQPALDWVQATLAEGIFTNPLDDVGES